MFQQNMFCLPGVVCPSWCSINMNHYMCHAWPPYFQELVSRVYQAQVSQVPPLSSFYVRAICRVYWGVSTFWNGRTATWHFLFGIFCVLSPRYVCLVVSYFVSQCPTMCPRTREFSDVRHELDKQQSAEPSFLTPARNLHLSKLTRNMYVLQMRPIWFPR